MTQPIITDAAGVLRYKENALVSYLLEKGGLTMNDLALVPFPIEDRRQFAQLIGYSVDGYQELSYTADEGGMRPYTVLLMLPDYWRSDQPCVADEVIRIWVEAENPALAVGTALVTLPSEMPDEGVIAEDFSPIAVYPGHLFDEYVT